MVPAIITSCGSGLIRARSACFGAMPTTSSNRMIAGAEMDTTQSAKPEPRWPGARWPRELGGQMLITVSNVYAEHLPGAEVFIR